MNRVKRLGIEHFLIICIIITVVYLSLRPGAICLYITDRNKSHAFRILKRLGMHREDCAAAYYACFEYFHDGELDYHNVFNASSQKGARLYPTDIAYVIPAGLPDQCLLYYSGGPARPISIMQFGRGLPRGSLLFLMGLSTGPRHISIRSWILLRIGSPHSTKGSLASPA